MSYIQLFLFNKLWKTLFREKLWKPGDWCVRSNAGGSSASFHVSEQLQAHPLMPISSFRSNYCSPALKDDSK